MIQVRESMNQAGLHPRPRKSAQPRSRAVRQGTVAGLVNAVVRVPDGLASATLAGVNPVYGLYASIAAPIAGSALVSAQLMQISTTSASALAAGRSLLGIRWVSEMTYCSSNRQRAGVFSQY